MHCVNQPLVILVLNNSYGWVKNLLIGHTAQHISDFCQRETLENIDTVSECHNEALIAHGE